MIGKISNSIANRISFLESIKIRLVVDLCRGNKPAEPIALSAQHWHCMCVVQSASKAFFSRFFCALKSNNNITFLRCPHHISICRCVVFCLFLLCWRVQQMLCCDIFLVFFLGYLYHLYVHHTHGLGGWIITGFPVYVNTRRKKLRKTWVLNCFYKGKQSSLLHWRA